MGIKNWFRNIGSNTLYYPGCLTKGVLKQQFENYKEIFNILGIEYILLPEEVCCGLPILNGGYKKDVRNLAQKNLELFKNYKVKKIITSCPSCYHTFKEIYPKLIRDWDIKVEHATVTIFNKIKGKKYQVGPESVTYHDPCHLGRYSGIYDEPRQVIRILGGKVNEMSHNKKEALCCGGGGGVRANFPELAKEIAKKRVEYVNEDTKYIISPCGLCYSNLKSASNKSIEFSDFVLKKLKEAKG